MTRRRFLTISAACALAPTGARAEVWQGRAFGGEVSLHIHAPRDLAAQAIAVARATMAEVEALFSLHDPASALVRLNKTGTLADPEPRFGALLAQADVAYRATGGRFDPTVQPLWRALATGGDVQKGHAAIGWDRVRVTPAAIRLAPGQALTLNGIAQGYATDQVSAALRGLGLGDVLVNMGEYRALGGAFQLAVSDPVAGYLGNLSLTDSAVATSSPGALALGHHAHILHSHHRPQWATVTVEAETAALADSLSTGLVLGGRDLAGQVRQMEGVRRILLVDQAGDLITL